MFEISHEVKDTTYCKDTTYWVREIPTPQRAVELVEENGGAPQEERSKPRRGTEKNEE